MLIVIIVVHCLIQIINIRPSTLAKSHYIARYNIFLFRNDGIQRELSTIDNLHLLLGGATLGALSLDLVYNIHASNDLAEDNMLAIQPAKAFSGASASNIQPTNN